MSGFDGKTLDELIALRVVGRRKLLTLQMCDLADQRVAAHYEPYAPDADAQLERNMMAISRLQQALRNLDAAIAKAEGKP